MGGGRGDVGKLENWKDVPPPPGKIRSARRESKHLPALRFRFLTIG